MSTDDAVAFETLIYTDCVPGQGLQGSAGLQFQARSPGADRAAMSLVQSADLYEPPARWMRERRPVEDYPPSFAHVFDGVYATAAGVYLGREANGGREGNQLTHAIVTGDPGSYLLHRPAQLFGADFWSSRPADTTECEPVRHPWEPGPFDIAGAQTLVTDNPRGAVLLGRLLASLRALDTPNARRVLFIAEDAAEVLKWISAATLLLPQRQALGIGFKVFTTNPAYATQPVVAVHPGWDSTAVSVDDDGGYAVFDLTTNRSTEVEVDDLTAQWVRLLLEEDPFDVLDMVEMAAATEWKDPAEALELARLMVLPGHRLSHGGARIAVSWLKSTPRELLASSREVLVDKLLADVTQWPQEVLLDLDEVARTGQTDPARMPEVRIALITAELDRAARHGTAAGVTLDPLPPGVWDARHSQECAARVVDELRDCRDATAFDAVVRVAHRFGLSIDFDEIPEALADFARHWAEHPEIKYPTKQWGAAADPLLRALRGELTERVMAGRGQEVGDVWWPRFDESYPLTERPLGAALLSARMVHSDPDDRVHIVEDAVEAAIAAPDAAVVTQRTLAALWRRLPLSHADCQLLTRLLPKGFPLDAGFFGAFLREITSSTARLEHIDIEVLRGLCDKDLIPRTEAVERLLRSDHDLAEVHRRLPGADVKALNEFPAVVRDTTMPVRRLWADEIADAMLAVRHPYASDKLLKQLPPEVHRRYLRALLDRLQKPVDAIPAVVAFQLSGVDFLRPEHRDACQSWVEHWIRKANDRRRRQATDLVAQVATRARQDEWAALIEKRDQHTRSLWSRRKTEG